MEAVKYPELTYTRLLVRVSMPDRKPFDCQKRRLITSLVTPQRLYNMTHLRFFPGIFFGGGGSRAATIAFAGTMLAK